MKRRTDDAANLRGPFRIRVVAELTGVPEPTLRAWERRYGIPSPERTGSGYRLYGPREVEQVRELRRLCEQGMAAAEAAKLVRAGGGPEPRAALSAKDGYVLACDAIVTAVESFDAQGLDLQLRRLPFLGSNTQIIDEVVAPALRAIGEKWHQGDLSVAQEHLVSQRFETLLRQLLELSNNVEPGARVILACFAGEDHQLGLLGTATRLAGWGFAPVVLGARTPPSAVRAAVVALAPRLVALSVTVPPPRAALAKLLDEYATACAGDPRIVGGVGAEKIAAEIRKRRGLVAPADASTLRTLLRTVLGASGIEQGPELRPTSRRKA